MNFLNLLLWNLQCDARFTILKHGGGIQRSVNNPTAIPLEGKNQESNQTNHDGAFFACHISKSLEAEFLSNCFCWCKNWAVYFFSSNPFQATQYRFFFVTSQHKTDIGKTLFLTITYLQASPGTQTLFKYWTQSFPVQLNSKQTFELEVWRRKIGKFKKPTVLWGAFVSFCHLFGPL